MFPVWLRLGPFSLTSFGFFLGLGVFLGLYFFVRFARRAGFNEGKILDLSFSSLLSAFFLARLLDFWYRPGLSFWSGSLSFAGGVLGFSGAAYWYLARRRWSYRKIGDGLLPAILLAFAFGEVGYFLSVRPWGFFHFLWALFYLLAFGTAALFLKKEPRTGATFYLYGAVFFFLYLLSQLALWRFFSVDFLVALAYLGFFVLGWKKGGYMVSFTYPREFVQKLKERLLRYRGKIEEEEKQISAEDVLLEGGEASRSAEAIDEASEEIGHSFVQVTLSRLRDLKKQIDEALGKMRVGKYGLCERCGQPIDKARLEAFPEATLCLRCEQMREEKVAS